MVLGPVWGGVAAASAASSQRRGTLTTLLMPITRSVYRQRAGAIVAAQADELLRWEYPLLPVQ